MKSWSRKFITIRHFMVCNAFIFSGNRIMENNKSDFRRSPLHDKLNFEKLMRKLSDGGKGQVEEPSTSWYHVENHTINFNR